MSDPNTPTPDGGADRTPPPPPAYGDQPAYSQPSAAGQQPANGQPAGYGQQPAAYSGQPYGAQPYGAPAAPKTPVLGIIGMILGILGVLISIFGGFGLLFSIAAIVLGFLGRAKERAAKGFWLTALITGFVGVLISVGWIIFYVVAIAAGIGSYSSYGN